MRQVLKTTRTVASFIALLFMVVSCTKAEIDDVKMFGLYGNVKSIEDYMFFETSISFDEAKRLVQIGDYQIVYNGNTDGQVIGGAAVHRDEQGRILWVGKAEGCSGEEGFHFEYADDVMSKWWHDTGECTGMVTTVFVNYDEKGRPIETKKEWFDEEIRGESTDLYEYSGADKWGNWTSREANTDYTIYSINSEDGSEHYVDSRESTTEQTRTIVYY